MSTVLLATDGSEIATDAVRRGVEILGGDHRYLALTVVLPAYAPAAAVAPMDTHPTVIDPVLEDEIEREDRERSVAEIEALGRVLGVALEPLVEMGDPGSTICAVAEREAADVVVLGSHGHGWLQRVLIGSVSSHVLHHAPCAVMVMRRSD